MDCFACPQQLNHSGWVDGTIERVSKVNDAINPCSLDVFQDRIESNIIAVNVCYNRDSHACTARQSRPVAPDATVCENAIEKIAAMGKRRT